MSNYVKTTDFAGKDILASGNPAKAVKGVDLGTEFDAIASMSATKADTSAAALLAATQTFTAVNTFSAKPVMTAGLTLSTGAGQALNITGVNNADTTVIQGGATSGQSFGLQIQAGTTAGDYCASLRNRANTEIFRVQGDGKVQAADQSNTLQDVGWRDAPPNTQSTSYALVMADRGKAVIFSAVGPLTCSIPANSSVAFPVGTCITIVNNTSNSLTIAIATDALFFAGTTLGGAGASRSLAGSATIVGVATIVKITATAWAITGAGLS